MGESMAEGDGRRQERRRTYRHLVRVPIAEFAQSIAERSAREDLVAKGIDTDGVKVTSEVVAHHGGSVHTVWEIEVTAVCGEDEEPAADTPAVVEGRHG